MRRPHPREALETRRRARAHVQLVAAPQSAAGPDGSVTSKQVADVTLPRSELDRVWHPEYLERLARTYWLFLTRISLGLLRVLYSPFSREVVLLRRPFRLLTFRGPRYRAEANRGEVTWPIDRGILVAPNGRGKGYLRITVERPDQEATPASDEVTIRVSSEVANFYPAIAAGWLPRWIARIGSFVYRVTQLRIHVIVTNAFLRSLARLELAPSVVGALRARAREAAAEGDLETMAAASATAGAEERRQARAAER